jgi:hypothetical protein
MALIPLQIQAGVFRNGTEFEQSNRWRDASLVRWHNGSMRPVGGWSTRVSSAFDAAARGMHSWVDNSDDSHIVAGTYAKLFHVNASGTVVEITPSGLTAGSEDAAVNLGYGGGYYGLGYYGVERPNTGVFQEATTWSLDNWGEYLVACSPQDGKLYEWQLDTGVVAAQISNAPVDNLGLIVTEERFLFALGAGSNPRKVQWCDREDNTTWTPDATNEAGDIELQTNGQIMAAARVRGKTLIVTDNDAHSATYQGPPFVYGFERVGTACGLVSRKAIASIDDGAFWMGARGFFMFDGSIAREIPCDVSDYVFADINKNQISKTYAVHNSQYGEIWWFYPSNDSLENNKYVAFDYLEKHWEIGEIDRTCGVDRGVFTNPIWVDASGNIYDQELSEQLGHGSYDVFAETGPISLGAGDNIMKVTSLIPDEKTQGDVTVTFKTRFYPNDSESSFGPYTMSNPTDVRFSGRQVRMRVDGARNTAWRSGVMRIEAKPGGNR